MGKMTFLNYFFFSYDKSFKKFILKDIQAFLTALYTQLNPIKFIN